MRSDSVTGCRRCEVDDRIEPELAAYDGGPLDHRALVVAQLVEALRQQGLDRRWHRHGHRRFAVVGLGEHRGHLLEEKRVPFRRLPYPAHLARPRLAAAKPAWQGRSEERR